MIQSVGNVYKLGQVADSGELEHLLGQIAWFYDVSRDDTHVLGANSNMAIRARWVKNESGGALEAGSVCAWDTGSTYGPGQAVTGEAASATTVGIGVVDPWISADVADNEHFYLIERGPCKFKFTTGTALSIGDHLAVGASGRVTKLDHTSLTDQLIFDRCGVALAAVTSGTASDTLFRAFADFRF